MNIVKCQLFQCPDCTSLHESEKEATICCVVDPSPYAGFPLGRRPYRHFAWAVEGFFSRCMVKTSRNCNDLFSDSSAHWVIQDWWVWERDQ